MNRNVREITSVVLATAALTGFLATAVSAQEETKTATTTETKKKDKNSKDWQRVDQKD